MKQNEAQDYIILFSGFVKRRIPAILKRLQGVKQLCCETTAETLGTQNNNSRKIKPPAVKLN